MPKKNKKELCEHSWLPYSFNYDNQVFGVTDQDDDIFLESDFIIVQCDECGKFGYVIAERIK